MQVNYIMQLYIETKKNATEIPSTCQTNVKHAKLHRLKTIQFKFELTEIKVECNGKVSPKNHFVSSQERLFHNA